MKLKLNHKEKLALMYVLSLGLEVLTEHPKKRGNAQAFNIVYDIIVRMRGASHE